MDYELEDCHFCGEESVHLADASVGVRKGIQIGFAVACEACGARGPALSTEAGARVAWNKANQKLKEAVSAHAEEACRLEREKRLLGEQVDLLHAGLKQRAQGLEFLAKLCENSSDQIISKAGEFALILSQVIPPSTGSSDA